MIGHACTSDRKKGNRFNHPGLFMVNPNGRLLGGTLQRTRKAALTLAPLETEAPKNEGCRLGNSVPWPALGVLEIGTECFETEKDYAGQGEKGPERPHSAPRQRQGVGKVDVNPEEFTSPMQPTPWSSDYPREAIQSLCGESIPLDSSVLRISLSASLVSLFPSPHRSTDPEEKPHGEGKEEGRGRHFKAGCSRAQT